MKEFNCFIGKTICVFILLMLVINGFLLVNAKKSRFDKTYEIEINRIMYSEDMELKNKSTIVQIISIPYHSEKEKLEEFFSNEGNSSEVDYTIRIIYKNKIPTMYVKFIYRIQSSNTKVAIFFLINSILMVSLGIILYLLIYIRKRVIKPFDAIKKLPEQLSKGALVKPIQASSNKYFGKFLWGLDMLRETLNREKAQSVALEKDKKLLILSISHDIKTPLSSIKLYAKALYDNLYSEELKKQEIARNIEKNANQIDHFIAEIVKSQKDNLDEMVVKDTEFYLKELLKRINEYYKERLILLKTDLEMGSYTNSLLKGDIDKLCEVFENIIENSIKYGDGRRIAISFQREDYCQLITVFNTGSSLEEEELVHVFDSFWRGKNSKGKEGSGLGLFICKKIMMLMKGDVFVQNINSGIAFTVVIREA